MSEAVGVEERRPDGDEGRYSYEIHSSGALIIWVARGGGEAAEVDVAYGPGAWIKASGTRR
ncbi:MAG: hypothetical protein JWL99_881 [Streptomyces oryziradicis]|jgi:hypothetical protein|nr:hypothetical protein [Actinacidiphila oryziradicis]